VALNEQTADVRSSAELPSLQAAPPDGNSDLEMIRGRRPLLSLARKLHKNETALAFMRNAFRMFQRIGISVSPNHYYWPVPDFRELEARTWPAEQDPVGFDLAYDRQLDFLQTVVPQFQPEWVSSSAPFFSVSYNYNNGFFETVDAEIAYSLVRYYKPRRIVEVGGGYSSRVMAAALDQNLKLDGVRGELVTIDPYPDRFPKKALSDRVHLIPQTIQNVDLDVFLSLQSGDFLFLDSSHVVGIGSDVVREYLEILPRVAGGVVIHAHDIFIPSDYPREAVLHNLAFWSEQYLLQALLMFNPQFEVLWGSSAMQSREPVALERAFPHWKHSYRNMPVEKRRFLPTRNGDRVWPSSFWMRKRV
jgi:methyltransferase family protein